MGDEPARAANLVGGVAEGWRKRRIVVSAHPDRFSPGSLERACVRTVRNCHSPRGRATRSRLIFPRGFTGKSVITGKNRVSPRRMSFCGLGIFFLPVITGRVTTARTFRPERIAGPRVTVQPPIGYQFPLQLGQRRAFCATSSFRRDVASRDGEA